MGGNCIDMYDRRGHGACVPERNTLSYHRRNIASEQRMPYAGGVGSASTGRWAFNACLNMRLKAR